MTLARNAGSCRSRAIANSSREVATWATSELAKPHAMAVATAVSTSSQCAAGDLGRVVERVARRVAVVEQRGRVGDEQRGHPGLRR